MSRMEWTEKTWHCITGCTHCYSVNVTSLKAMGQAEYANGFKLTIYTDLLETTLEW